MDNLKHALRNFLPEYRASLDQIRVRIVSGQYRRKDTGDIFGTTF